MRELDKALYTAIVRVQNAPHLHTELTQKIGEPTECFCESAERRESLWTIESPVSAWSGIAEHLAWATELVDNHAKLFRRIVGSGIRIVLHIACTTESEYTLSSFDSSLLKPLIDAGVGLEFYSGLHSSK